MGGADASTAPIPPGQGTDGSTATDASDRASPTADSGDASDGGTTNPVTLLDDDFESDPGPYCKGWASGGEIVPAPVHGGAAACSYCPIASGATIIYAFPGPASTGTYALDMYAYSTKSGALTAKLDVLNPGPTTVVPVAQSVSLTAATWIHVHGTAQVVNVGTNGIQLEIGLDGTELGCFRMDDVKLTRQ
jgi:hypothetical protein